MSSAQAAATAAFSASKSNSDSSARKQKPTLRLSTDIKNGSPKSDTQRLASGCSRASPPGANDGRSTSTPGTPKQQGKRSPESVARPNFTVVTTPSRRSAGMVRRSSRTTPGSIGRRSGRSSRGSRASVEMGVELGISSLTGYDYFNLPDSGSGSPGDVGCATPTLQAPISTNPQDMLASVRQSISLKTKVGTSKDAVHKSNLALHEFRSSVENRRKVSQAAPYMSSHEDIQNRRIASSGSSKQGSAENVSKIMGKNRSQSSLGSVISDTNSTDGAVMLPPNFKFTYVSDATSSDGLKIMISDLYDAPSPIPIPLSSQSKNRNLTTTANRLAKLSISTETINASSSEVLADPTIKLAKPGRKKPPSFNDMESFGETSGSDFEYGGPALRNNDPEADESESIKLPLFPEIAEKSHHRINLFSKKRKKKRDSGVVYDPDGQPAYENDHPLVHNTNGAWKKSGRSVHPVKLRTTMREEHKRKEKKTAFDEDKPWKNHGDLDIISDAQRKRYEGLWVSNKGLYLDHVIVKLTGVNYDGKMRTSSQQNARELTESDVSEQAAKLSANLNVDSSQPDLKELHSLEEATIDNLMHATVVRKLWNRSNLPRETLMTIWDLVDHRKDSTLSKAEFIVGMWLVDQCLYGRKLPKVVNKSVWSSLGGLGVNVVIKKKRR